ncbi:hypothetical protein CSA37_07665 [Candidatus Fermentibacteria bacterium]|nr:MAG: hypothetical protein CSA37_07665 [Candidatus Fermentibacteria bacterium]
MRIPVITALLLFTAVALAGSLPFAHYGVLDTPSASLLRHSEIGFGMAGSVYSVDDSSGSSNMDVSVAGYLELGLFGRGQIGGSFLGSGGFSGTARGLIFAETITRPGFVAGVENITGEKNYDFFRDDNDSLYTYPVSQNLSIYGVFTKDFTYLISFPVKISIGYGTGRFQQSDESQDGFDNPIPGLFGSIHFTPLPETVFELEWDGRDINAGGRYRLNRNFTITAAASEIEYLFGSDSTSDGDVMQTPKFTVGIQGAFGPILGRTELDPYEKLRYTDDDEALRQLEEYRAGAREEIRELEDSIR